MSKTNMTLSGLFMMLFLMVIASCDGGGDGSNSAAGTNISGMAAAGAPIVGTVNIRGANGNVSLSAIEADGSYTVDVAALTAPFLIWVEGTANGKSVKLYTSVDSTEENANVTPATNLVLTMALGADPAEVYEADPDADVPDPTEIVSAAQNVQTLLSSVFESLDMSEDFDVMNGEFVVGESFDKILDTVSFQVDSSNPDDVTVAISDKSSGETLFEHNATSGTTEFEMAPDQIEEIVGSNLTFQEEALAMFKKIETLYEISEPTAEELNAALLPYVASDFLDDGMGRDDIVDNWLEDEDDGPVVGITVTALSIYREMSKNKTKAGYEIDEMPGYDEGNWCLVTLNENGITDSFITSFVRGSDGVVRWYGNRDPFYDGGDVDSKHVFENSEYSGESMWSGLNFWTEDSGNMALNTYGIDAFIVLHPSLPDLADVGFPGINGLLIERRSDIETTYQITSITPAHWWQAYSEDDGLDIDDLTAGDEFFFIGVDIDTQEFKHSWIDSLAAVPIKGSELTKDHFPVITTPTSSSDVTIPGVVTVTWTMPTALDTISDWVSINFGADSNWTQYGNDSPEWGEEWLTTTFDTSDTSITSPTWFNVEVSAETSSGLDFEVINSFSL